MHKEMLQVILFSSLWVITGCQASPKSNDHELALLNVQMGMHYFQQQAYHLAKQKLIVAEQQAPKHPAVAAAWGYYYEHVDEIELAQRYYQRAIHYSRRSGKQLNNYAVFLCRQSRFEQAEQYFLAAIDDPHYINTAMAYENAGLCAKKNGRIRQAREHFKRALVHDPNRQVAAIELQLLEDNNVHTQ